MRSLCDRRSVRLLITEKRQVAVCEKNCKSTPLFEDFCAPRQKFSFSWSKSHDFGWLLRLAACNSNLTAKHSRCEAVVGTWSWQLRKLPPITCPLLSGLPAAGARSLHYHQSAPFQKKQIFVDYFWLHFLVSWLKIETLWQPGPQRTGEVLVVLVFSWNMFRQRVFLKKWRIESAQRWYQKNLRSLDKRLRSFKKLQPLEKNWATGVLWCFDPLVLWSFGALNTGPCQCVKRNTHRSRKFWRNEERQHGKKKKGDNKQIYTLFKTTK